MTFPNLACFNNINPQLKRTAEQAGLNAADCLPKLHLPGEEPPKTPGLAPQIPMGGLAGVQSDPRYAAMVSRVAAYYQHRCQAITTFQHQRCQAWASVHREKCQEMMQASMLVVAWYIRDRISRRRRKDKKKFRRVLQERSTRPSKVTRGETVRRWVMQVPDVTLPPHAPASTEKRDPEEGRFDLDGEAPPDKDAKLYEMADTLIRSQYRKIQIPMMGVLNLDESESESELDDDLDDDNDERLDEDEDDNEMEDDTPDDDDLFDPDDAYLDGFGTGSEVVHHSVGSDGRHKDSSTSS
jgi:hypothetical protein